MYSTSAHAQLMHQGYITYVCQHIITIYNGFDKTMNYIIKNALPISFSSYTLFFL